MRTVRTKLWASVLVGSAVAALAAACGSTSTEEKETTPDPPAGTAKSEVARDTSPDVTDVELRTLTADNARFGMDLFRQVSDGDEQNAFLSPHSISVALAMTYAGADGETRSQMAQALRFTLADDKLHAAFNRLDLELEQRSAEASPEEGEGFKLNVVNAIWAQHDYPWQMPYLDTIALNYGSGLNLVDFISDPDGARQDINAWVGDQTEDLIPELLPPGSIDKSARMVLTNAIYFNASWSEPFDEGATADDVFHAADGSEVTVPMMAKTESMRYGTGDGYVGIQMHYEGAPMAMTVVIPDAGKMAEVKANLPSDWYAEIADDATYEKVSLRMPKFEVRWGTSSVKPALESLGMKDAFVNGVADFSPMAGPDHPLFVGDVMHQAFVSVDEKGTEAAAATAVVMADGGVAPNPEEPIPVTVDRPFLFAIHDTSNGALLFVGEVVDPS